MGAVASTGGVSVAVYNDALTKGLDSNMKWILGGLLLAVVGAVYKRPELMSWVVYCFGALFIFMGFALFFAFSRNKHHGLLLLGITYVTAAAAAIALTQWWPLVAGLAIAWVMRAMGMEPAPGDIPDGQAIIQTPTSPPSEEDKKG